MVDGDSEPSGPADGENSWEAVSAKLVTAAPADIRDVAFHAAVRGYDRREVDRYVQRVNVVIAELELARSPESAVRHALDRVGEQTSAILLRARDSADEIVESARVDADETKKRGGAEASQIVAGARATAQDVVAAAETTAGERVEEGKREFAAAHKRAEEIHTTADSELANARSEASEIVAQAEARGREIVGVAEAQIAERRGREERELEQLRSRAESELHALRAATEGIAEERQRVLESVGALAAQLHAIADPRAAHARPAGKDDDDGSPATGGSPVHDTPPDSDPGG